MFVNGCSWILSKTKYILPVFIEVHVLRFAFCFVLFWLVLSCFVLFCLVLFCLMFSCLMSSCVVSSSITVIKLPSQRSQLRIKEAERRRTYIEVRLIGVERAIEANRHQASASVIEKKCRIDSSSKTKSKSSTCQRWKKALPASCFTRPQVYHGSSLKHHF